MQIPTETLVSFHLQSPISVTTSKTWEVHTAGTVCNNDSSGNAASWRLDAGGGKLQIPRLRSHD